MDEPTPTKQQKLDTELETQPVLKQTPQKSAAELLAEITAESNEYNTRADGTSLHGLDLHGKTMDELNEFLKMENLTKNQQKKIARYKTFLERAPERRAKKKIKQKASGGRKFKNKKMATKENLELNFHLGLDLRLDDLMSSKNLSDLSRQIQWLYMVNKHLNFSTQLWFCGREKRLEDVIKYQHNGEANWDMHWFDEEFTKLPHGKDNVVYLSSDSENVLRKIEPGKVYMIGGLVDRNSHKGHCHKRALELGYQTAKFPLGDYVDFEELDRPLTVNHVSEIFTRVVDQVCKKHCENNGIDYTELEFKNPGVPAGINPEKPNNVKIESIDQTKFWEEAIIQTLPRRKSVKVKKEDGGVDDSGYKKRTKKERAKEQASRRKIEVADNEEGNVEDSKVKDGQAGDANNEDSNIDNGSTESGKIETSKSENVEMKDIAEIGRAHV